MKSEGFRSTPTVDCHILPVKVPLFRCPPWPYEVVDPLGKGAMGEVYRARDTRLGLDVAVKVLPDHTAGSSALRAMVTWRADPATRRG